MAQASEFVIIPKNDGGKKSNDGEELGGRGSVNVDVAVIVTKLEEFVKEQVELTFFSTAAGYWLMSFGATRNVLILKAHNKTKFKPNLIYSIRSYRLKTCSMIYACSGMSGQVFSYGLFTFGLFRGAMTVAALECMQFYIVLRDLLNCC